MKVAFWSAGWIFGALLIGARAVAAEDASPAAPPWPDPARLASDVAAFEAADRDSLPPEGAILCTGSSSMRMWHPTLARDLAPLTVIPRGFGGSTMFDAVTFAPRIVTRYRPRAVVLYEGDNDVEAGIAPERIRDAFLAFADTVFAAGPGTRIYVLAVKPSRARWKLWPRMREANELLAAACADDERLTFVDVATPMLGGDGAPRPDIFLEDGLHMNAAGYAIWRDVLRPALLARELAFEPERAGAGGR